MEIYKEFIVFPIDYNKKIVFLSTENVKTSWNFEVDWNFPLIKTKPKMFLESGNEENGKTEEAEKTDETLSIQHLTVSEANNLLAFTTSDKSLFLCKIEESSVVTLSRRMFLRTASIIKFNSSGKSLILSDKTGDTFEYTCEDVAKPGRWIFGHISQILDLQIKSDFSCIVTSDRDEKIRVTNYPATHEIQAILVGHKEFVSSLAFFNNEKVLLSVSGDKTLRLWNYDNGKQLQVINLDYVPIKVASSEGLLAITSDDSTLYIYNYDLISPENVKIHLIGQKTYNAEHEFTARGNKIFVKYIQDDEDVKKLLVDKVTVTGGSVSFDLLSDVFNDLDLKLKPSFTIFKTFDVSLLFKKKFDNVKQYIDRKKARIENQESKKK